MARRVIMIAFSATRFSGLTCQRPLASPGERDRVRGYNGLSCIYNKPGHTRFFRSRARARATFTFTDRQCNTSILPPHPGPLPQGRGRRKPGSRELSTDADDDRRLIRSKATLKRMPALSTSPRPVGGEGQGEGVKWPVAWTLTCALPRSTFPPGVDGCKGEHFSPMSGRSSSQIQFLTHS